MKAPFLSVLLLTAAFPLAALAQDSSNDSQSSGSGTSQTDNSGGMNSGNSSNDGSTGTLDPSGTNSITTESGNAGGDATDPSASSSAEQVGSGPGTSTDMFVTLPGSGTWRVADLQGKTVYSLDGADIGEINDVVLSQNGSVNAVIIGVGGYLGMGEKNVAVNVSSLQVVPGDTAGPTAATGTESDDSSTGPGSNPGGADRLVLNVTRAQLEAAPAYSGMGLQ